MNRRRKSVPGLTPDGHEIPDSTPVAPPIGYKKIPSLAEQIRQAILSEKLKEAAQSQGLETFEEADDFDVGDDFDPRSPYEESFEPVHPAPAPEAVQAAENRVVETLSPTEGAPEAPSTGGAPEGPPEAAKKPPKKA